MKKTQFIQLIEQEIEDFVQTQADKIVSFEDDPKEYILQKYPSLKSTLEDLMTDSFDEYVTGIYVMAPKPTTFKILLHNGQHFFLIYAKDSYIAKISGKKYYLSDLGAEEYAIKSIADLLTMGMPPGAEGPDQQAENDMTKDADETPDAEPTGDTAGDEEELAENVDDDEKDDYGRPFVDPKGSRTYMSDKEMEDMKPSSRILKKMMDKLEKKLPSKKLRILKEAEEKKTLRFRILKENDAESGIEILKKELGFTDDNFIKQSSVTYKLLVPRADRISIASQIDQIEDFEFDPNLKGSSIGGIKYKNTKFLLKPSGVQGRASAGTQNEDVLVNEVKKYLELGAKNVIFQGTNQNYVTKNIKEILDVGYDTASGKKADVVLVGDKKYPISIKKDNAGFWESSDTRYKDVVLKLSDKIKNGDFAPQLVFKPFVDKMGNTKEDINIMFNDETNKPITGVIVTDLPTKDGQSIIFGSDNAVVIYKTYLPSDFDLQGENLNVKVNNIITDLKQIEELNLEPILNIRRDVTRTATGGIRATVQPEKLLYRDGKLTGDKMELSYNQIMN